MNENEINELIAWLEERIAHSKIASEESYSVLPVSSAVYAGEAVGYLGALQKLKEFI